ncbi:MAG: hypothetical protein E5299_00096 [Burkholderia gladioli]|nr:MAG: hypothetical protein E5299_00096 [Burkholderia gladioli]
MWLTVTLWPSWLDQIPRDEQITVISDDGAYETKPCYAAIAARSAVPSIPLRKESFAPIVQRICLVRRGVMARLMQLLVTFVANKRKAVATICDRLLRMRCIGSRNALSTVSGRVTSRCRRTKIADRVGILIRNFDQ